MDQGKIGKFIAVCRREKGFTQEQLAAQLGITGKAVSKWETGRGLPDPSEYSSLCEILGITADELLAGEKSDTDLENEAKDRLAELLISRLYRADCGISYGEFRNALLRMSEAAVILSRFGSREEAVAYLVQETGLSEEECAEGYDRYVSFQQGLGQCPNKKR